MGKELIDMTKMKFRNPNIASTIETIKAMSKKYELKEWAKSIIIPLAITYILFGVVFAPAINEGWSMYPTLREGDVLLLQRICYTPQYEDIVVVRIDALQRNYTKRIIGLPGDTIYIDTDTGTVYRNEIALKEPYLGTPTLGDGDMGGHPVTVSEGHIFLMGDNRLHSNDSRYDIIGEVPAEKIIGRLITVLMKGKGEPSYGNYEKG